MKLFLIRAAVFFTLSGLVAVALDYAVSGGLRKSNYNEFEGWSDICEGTINADLVLLGSSRAMDHFATPVLDSMLNLNSYNLGYSGGRFSDWKLKFDIYKQRNIKPKYLVISLDLFAFSPKEGVADQVQLYPYIRYDGVREYLMAEAGLSWHKANLPFIRYAGDSYVVGVGLLEFFNVKHFKKKKIKGYSPRNVKWDGKFERMLKKHPRGYKQSFNDALFQQFQSFVQSCVQEGIQVILVYSPELAEGQRLSLNRSEIMGKYSDLANSLGIRFLDYSPADMNRDRTFFHNSTHLNQKGAEIFSAMFAGDLSRVMDQSVVSNF